MKLVRTDSELLAAIKDKSIGVIKLAPGTYRAKDIVKGVNRKDNPLKICGENPHNRPVFYGACQDISNTHYVTFKDIIFKSDGGITGEFWIYDGGGTGEGVNATHIGIIGCEFISREPADLHKATEDKNYSSGMVRCIRLSNYATHTYIIKDCIFRSCMSIGDFVMNGEVLMDNLFVDKFYFDGLRITGTGDEGRVDGNRVISNVSIKNNLARYEEMENKAPHPDFTQFFNNGSKRNNTNPRIDNLMFYQCRFLGGNYRSNNVQAGLTQTKMNNVMYVESLWCPHNSPHGISLEGGGSGVAIERMTLQSTNFGSSAWVRLLGMSGEVKIKDSYVKAGVNTLSHRPNKAGFELIESGNSIKYKPSNVFAGPEKPGSIGHLMRAMTPKKDDGKGALDGSGKFRNLPHIPAQSKSPDVTIGANGFRLDKVHLPTLNSPNQKAQGGEIYTQTDLRFSPVGQYKWSVKHDIREGDFFEAKGRIEIQTRLKNKSGFGLWSKSMAVNITGKDKIEDLQEPEKENQKVVIEVKEPQKEEPKKVTENTNTPISTELKANKVTLKAQEGSVTVSINSNESGELTIIVAAKEINKTGE